MRLTLCECDRRRSLSVFTWRRALPVVMMNPPRGNALWRVGRLAELLPPPPGAVFVMLEATCEDDDDDDVELPSIRFRAPVPSAA